MTADTERQGKEGLDRCHGQFVKNLYISLVDSPRQVEIDEMRERLSERLTESQIETVKRSYLLCLSVPETVRRLHNDPLETISCPVCDGDIIHLGECDSSREGDET